MSPFPIIPVLPFRVIQYCVRTLGIWKVRSTGLTLEKAGVLSRACTPSATTAPSSFGRGLPLS